ncbi:hypothetical protein KUTeg_016523, partial [Tegillarca granosa]
SNIHPPIQSDEVEIPSENVTTQPNSFNIEVEYEEPSSQKLILWYRIDARNTIHDQSVRHIDVGDEELTYTIVESGTQRSKRKLVDSHGYTYNVKRQRKTTTDWQCTVRSKKVMCMATVKQTGDTFEMGKGHIHTVQPGTLEAVKIKAQIKSEAQANVHRAASAIVEEALGLDSIVDSMPSRPAIQVAVSDFEKGIWKGVQHVFPGISIRGCNFHFTQAVWRRIQRYGLAFAYFKRDEKVDGTAIPTRGAHQAFICRSLRVETGPICWQDMDKQQDLQDLNLGGFRPADKHQ